MLRARCGDLTCRDQAWWRLCPVGLRAAGEGWDVKQGFPLLRHPRHLFFLLLFIFFSFCLDTFNV